MKSRFLYETHLHTKEASACARYTGAEQVQQYKAAGYSGIVVTDHFFNGNTCISKDLPWEERIELYCKGYENAKEEGDKIGLDVFFGVEVNFHGTEFLIYGISKEWLKEQNDMPSWTVEEQYKKVHEAGGFVIHAHPFRIRPYIDQFRLFPQCIDAVEVYNLGNKNAHFDQKAKDYASMYDFPATAGSDCHGKEEILSGIAFDHRLKDIQDMIESIRTRNCELLIH